MARALAWVCVCKSRMHIKTMNQPPFEGRTYRRLVTRVMCWVSWESVGENKYTDGIRHLCTFFWKRTSPCEWERPRLLLLKTAVPVCFTTPPDASTKLHEPDRVSLYSLLFKNTPPSPRFYEPPCPSPFPQPPSPLHQPPTPHPPPTLSSHSLTRPTTIPPNATIIQHQKSQQQEKTSPLPHHHITNPRGIDLSKKKKKGKEKKKQEARQQAGSYKPPQPRK